MASYLRTDETHLLAVGLFDVGTTAVTAVVVTAAVVVLVVTVAVAFVLRAAALGCARSRLGFLVRWIFAGALCVLWVKETGSKIGRG